jgi:Nif-specific ferredoxin III
MSMLSRDGRAWVPDYLIAIDQKTCIGCGRCFKVCGRNVMILKGLTEDHELVDVDPDNDDDDEEFERKIMTMSDAGACIGCGACARVCPKNCQTHSKAPPAWELAA